MRALEEGAAAGAVPDLSLLSKLARSHVRCLQVCARSSDVRHAFVVPEEIRVDGGSVVASGITPGVIAVRIRRVKNQPGILTKDIILVHGDNIEVTIAVSDSRRADAI